MSRKGGEFDNISDEWEELTPVQFAQCHAYIQERWPETVDEAEYQKRLHHLQQKAERKNRTMPVMTVKESKEFADVEDGAYDSVVKEITEVDGTYGPQFKVTFSLQAEGNPDVTAYCSQTLSTKSKLYQWCCAILGELKHGEEVDIPGDLLGKPCRILVANEQSKTDPDKWWPRVKKVGPPKAPKKAPSKVESTEF